MEADITEPEELLGATPPSGPVAPYEKRPSSTVLPPVGSVLSLRPGETLASAAGASIVIRRAKRA